MSKEYIGEKVLKDLKELHELAYGVDGWKIDEIVQSSHIKQALQRLNDIDNAEPSEAMECLECLYSDPEDYRSNDRAKDYETIKNYILKTQEQKKYLRWEDLEFKEEEQTMKVTLNGKEYILKYEKLKDYDVDRVRILDKCCYKYMMLHTSTKQFFNDLHLERVLE